jgi:hypothetical protein
VAQPPQPPPEYGTLIISILLIMTLAFAGLWIFLYAQNGRPPWDLAGWFAIGAVVVVVLGLTRYLRIWR